MVLLHLLRGEGIYPRVVFFREPWQPWKYEFHDKLIRDWDLEVYSWHPRESAIQCAGDEFEVQNWYQFNNSILTCPTGIVEPDDMLPMACGVDIVQRPKQEKLEIRNAEAVWVGHKGCDSDPVLGGDAGTRIEARYLPDHASMLMPLRDWSHDDVWEYIERYGVPYDEKRYVKEAGQWVERADRRHNSDYVHACMRCVDRREGAPKFVECPKLGMTIENIADRMPWVEAKKLSYMED